MVYGLKSIGAGNKGMNTQNVTQKSLATTKGITVSPLYANTAVTDAEQKIHPDILEQRILTVRDLVRIGGVGASLILKDFASKNPNLKVSDLAPTTKDDTLFIDYMRAMYRNDLTYMQSIKEDLDDDVVFYVRFLSDEESEEEYYLIAKHSLDSGDVLIYEFEDFSKLESLILDHTRRICVWCENSEAPRSNIINWDRSGNYYLEGFSDEDDWE